MKVAIVGSREYHDLDAVRRYVRSLPAGTTVVSGGARGVDKVAELEAEACGLPTEIHHAQWEQFGKSAGFQRNVSIVEASDRVVAFWDGSSRGTRHTMTLAERYGKPLEVFGSK